MKRLLIGLFIVAAGCATVKHRENYGHDCDGALVSKWKEEYVNSDLDWDDYQFLMRGYAEVCQ